MINYSYKLWLDQTVISWAFKWKIQQTAVCCLVPCQVFRSGLGSCLLTVACNNCGLFWHLNLQATVYSVALHCMITRLYEMAVCSPSRQVGKRQEAKKIYVKGGVCYVCIVHQLDSVAKIMLYYDIKMQSWTSSQFTALSETLSPMYHHC